MVKIVQIDWRKEGKTRKLEKENILRQRAKLVKKEEFGSKELQKILNDMKVAMDKEDDGVAIAAPQIGIEKRIFIIKEDAYKIKGEKSKWRPLVFINPRIIKASKKMVNVDEGCLSVRPLYGTTLRHTNTTIEAFDFEGNKFTFGGGGLISHIFQHECDHLDGILFIDHAENIQEIDLEKLKNK